MQQFPVKFIIIVHTNTNGNSQALTYCILIAVYYSQIFTNKMPIKLIASRLLTVVSADSFEVYCYCRTMVYKVLAQRIEKSMPHLATRGISQGVNLFKFADLSLDFKKNNSVFKFADLSVDFKRIIAW